MKKLVIIIIAATLILCIAMCTLVFISKLFNTNSFTRATVLFKYGDQNIREGMSEEDFEKIRSIFSNKLLIKDNSSCGFSKNIAVLFKDSSGKIITCCIAQDACGKVYVAEKDRYIKLSENEAKDLRKTVAKYGMTFPCL